MTSSRNYEVLCASNEPTIPLLVHIPHSSTYIPPDVRQTLLLNDLELDQELRVMTDWYTDELFNHALDIGGMMFVNRCSRLVVDPERFPNDAEEVMAGRGMGAVYTKTSDGSALRSEGPAGCRQDLLSRYFVPYAEAVADQVGRILDKHGHCLILDGHSFSSASLPYEHDQTLDRPEICIGTDSYHTPPKLVHAIQEICEQEGIKTACNRPFSGTYIPLSFWHIDKRVLGMMIEIRRNLYIDEKTAKRNTNFQQAHRVINRIIQCAVSR